jgi:ferritin
MISKNMQSALNAQINREQYSAQLYVAMGAHLDTLNFKGFAHWLRVQAEEETAHALKLIDFVLDRRGVPALAAVPAPPSDFGGVIEVFEKVLRHEQEITGHIHSLFEAARSEKDYASEVTLQWYVTEQVEEENTVSQIVDHLHAVGDKGGGIWYLDHQMGKRARK